MPIKRFAHALARDGREAEYMALLVAHFNPATVPELMCRHLVSVGWDGELYDCDFNQMLELPLGRPTPQRCGTSRACVGLEGEPVATGAPLPSPAPPARGSSCGGALA